MQLYSLVVRIVTDLAKLRYNWHGLTYRLWRYQRPDVVVRKALESQRSF